MKAKSKDIQEGGRQNYTLTDSHLRSSVTLDLIERQWFLFSQNNTINELSRVSGPSFFRC